MMAAAKPKDTLPQHMPITFQTKCISKCAFSLAIGRFDGTASLSAVMAALSVAITANLSKPFEGVEVVVVDNVSSSEMQLRAH